MTADIQQHRNPNRVHAYRVFFPAAALYAALAIPLAVHAMTTVSGWPPGLLGQGHAYEMLSGFALALIAGYLLGPVSRQRLAILFGLWLAARVTSVTWPGSLAADVLGPAFALVLAAHIAPKFLVAKKWRNRMISPLLLIICLLPAGHVLAMAFSQPEIGRELLQSGIVLLALLLAFMGGRVMAPAVAGAFYHQGMNLAARVQPRLEAALIILLALAVVLLTLPVGQVPAGLAMSSAGIIVAVRLWRWQLWQLHGRPDLLCLGAGYAWLALGLGLAGILIASGRPALPALHLITIGALGTLSICVMIRVHLQATRRDPSGGPALVVAVLLIAMASSLRWAMQADVTSVITLLWLSAAAWSLAYLLTAVQLLSYTKGESR